MIHSYSTAVPRGKVFCQLRLTLCDRLTELPALVHISIMQLTIGEQIKTLRKRRGFSQEFVGGVVDLSTYTIGKIESGETSPRVDQLKLIAGVLGVELSLSLKEIATPEA